MLINDSEYGYGELIWDHQLNWELLVADVTGKTIERKESAGGFEKSTFKMDHGPVDAIAIFYKNTLEAMFNDSEVRSALGEGTSGQPTEE